MTMDKIKAMLGKTKYAVEEHLSVYINDEPLDLFLANKLNDAGVYEGMVSAWLLDWHDEFNDFQEKDYVIKQSRLESSTKVLPILLCPDDFDFFCSVIVAEVIDNGDIVIWNRFGSDITPFSADEKELPPCIGKVVKWFTNISPLIFERGEYLSCMNAFGLFEDLKEG